MATLLRFCEECEKDREHSIEIVGERRIYVCPCGHEEPRYFSPDQICCGRQCEEVATRRFWWLGDPTPMCDRHSQDFAESRLEPVNLSSSDSAPDEVNA